MHLTADFSLSRLIKDYIEEIFNIRDVSPENRKKLWKYYFEKLSGGVEKGFTFDDKEMAKSLKMSVAEFSAFKETSFKSALENLLTTDGKLTAWKDFKEQAYQVDADYNQRYLETEYHQTIANAQAAAKWQDFQETKDLYPNLMFITVGDDRVRPEHEVLNGIIMPIDDPFWNSYYPPLDWGCRCSVEPSDAEPKGEIKGGYQPKLEFDNNPGKTGEIFGESAYQQNLTEAEIKEAKENLKDWLTE